MNLPPSSGPGQQTTILVKEFEIRRDGNQVHKNAMLKLDVSGRKEQIKHLALQASDKKLNSFENKCFRKLLNLKWSDFITNNTVRDQTHQEFVSNVIRKRRWNYLG